MRASHCAAEPLATAAPPRQICPPGCGLSSSRTTDLPDSAATVAAAIPAGPAPTTATSARIVCELFIGSNVHAGLNQNLTAFGMWNSVDDHAAFEADTHPAAWSSRLAADRSSRGHASDERCGGRGRPCRYFNRLPVDSNV